jgi:type VII secretion protein EccB
MPPTMQNRKDLLQAHRLMTQRAALALICGEPDSPNQPLRRRNTATVSAVLAGVIAAAVFGVLGLLSPGTVTGLTKAGTLVIDKDTATPYVPCQGDELCPSLNYASALLALDTTNVNRVDVDQATLSHYKIGPTIGISGLPQDLPTSADLVKGPWAVCAQNGVSTLVGGVSVGGTPLPIGQATLTTTASGSGAGTGGSGTDWVLWNGERLKITPGVMETIFNTSASAAAVVPLAWLNAIPEGPDFKAPFINGEDTLVTGPSGQAPVGRVYMVPGAAGTSTEFFVLMADGKLAQVTPVQASLLERVQGAKQQTISPAQAQGDLSATQVPAVGLPRNIPRLATMGSPVCVSYRAGLGRQFTTGGTIPSGAVPTSGGAGVDQVWLPPSHGALVGVIAGVDQPSKVVSWFLLSGATRYSLSSSAVANVLGYHLATDETVLPASVAELLPQGKVLDPGAATAQASPG